MQPLLCHRPTYYVQSARSIAQSLQDHHVDLVHLMKERMLCVCVSREQASDAEDAFENSCSWQSEAKSLRHLWTNLSHFES